MRTSKKVASGREISSAAVKAALGPTFVPMDQKIPAEQLNLEFVLQPLFLIFSIFHQVLEDFYEVEWAYETANRMFQLYADGPPDHLAKVKFDVTYKVFSKALLSFSQGHQEFLTTMDYHLKAISRNEYSDEEVSVVLNGLDTALKSYQGFQDKFRASVESIHTAASHFSFPSTKIGT